MSPLLGLSAALPNCINSTTASGMIEELRLIVLPCWHVTFSKWLLFGKLHFLHGSLCCFVHVILYSSGVTLNLIFEWLSGCLP